MAYGDFDKISVGDVVARLIPGGWNNRYESIERRTVTRKTATQITLDNGERYTQRLNRVGDSADRWSSRYSIQRWTEETDQHLSEMAEEARQQRVLRALREIDWRTLPAETRDAAHAALQAVGLKV